MSHDYHQDSFTEKIQEADDILSVWGNSQNQRLLFGCINGQDLFHAKMSKNSSGRYQEPSTLKMISWRLELTPRVFWVHQFHVFKMSKQPEKPWDVVEVADHFRMVNTR